MIFFVKYFSLCILFLIIPLKILNAECIVIKGVSVKSSAENLAYAKDDALIKADKKAFEMLKYFLYPKFTSNLDRRFDHNEVLKLISKFQVTYENFSKKVYEVIVDYYFDIDKVLTFFNDDIYDKNSKLLIPIFCLKDECYIWENEWFYSWKDASKGSVFFVIPEDIENIRNISDRNFNENTLRYLQKKYNALEIIIVKIIQEDYKNFKVIVERPIINQKKEILYVNSYNQNSKIFFHNLSIDLINNLYENLHSENVSILDNYELYQQIAVTNVKDWQEIKLIFKNYKYIVQYIGNNAIILELRSKVDLIKISRLLGNLGYSIVSIDENKWVISK